MEMGAFTPVRRRRDITYHERMGIIAYVRKLNNGKEPVLSRCILKAVWTRSRVEVAFQFVERLRGEYSWILQQYLFTQEGGTHLVGFKTKFTQLINPTRGTRHFKEKDNNFAGADTRNSMTAVVAVETPGSDLRGQTKDKACQRRCDQRLCSP